MQKDDSEAYNKEKHSKSTNARTTWKIKFEDTKGIIRSNKSKKDRQHNDQKKGVKKTNNDLKNITPKTKDWATQTPLKPVVNSGAPEE